MVDAMRDMGSDSAKQLQSELDAADDVHLVDD